MAEKKTILIAALDWGIGHATRLVPLIEQYKNNGHTVILASAGRSYTFLKNYFPETIILEKPAYNISYSEKYPLAIVLFFQLPSILLTIVKEHFWLKKIIQQFNVTDVFSDNCYGLWNKKIHSVFITHQLNILMPGGLWFMSTFIHKINSIFISRYDECFVPDFEEEPSLAGKLSHRKTKPANVKYIGPLSRFSKTIEHLQVENYDVVALLSGPEPHRTIFENKIVSLLTGQPLKCCIVRGRPGDNALQKNNETIFWYNHVSDGELISLLKNAKSVVCRSGYSTLMDLTVLKIPALLIPTPGQTEQEYLAQLHDGKGMFRMQTQEKFSLSDILITPDVRKAQKENDLIESSM